jgi:putative flippase GtrA
MENPIIDYQEQPNVSPFATALRYGIIGGVVSIILFLFLYLIDSYQSRAISFTMTIALLITFILLSQKSHRDIDLKGFMSYGRAIGVGMLTVLFMGLLNAVFSVVFLEFIDSSMVEDAIRKAEDDMIDRDMSSEQIEQSLKIAKFLSHPIFIFFGSLLREGVLGLIVALITGAITKRD